MTEVYAAKNPALLLSGISDEELALLGAPWQRGHALSQQYWESIGKRARDKSWLDVFVVIQKGELTCLFLGRILLGPWCFGGGNWLVSLLYKCLSH